MELEHVGLKAEQSGAAHRHKQVEHEHNMHGSMARRTWADLNVDLRWQSGRHTHSKRKERQRACGCKQAHSVRR
jgi:hypothetical protein